MAVVAMNPKMAIQKPTVRKHNKKLKRNLEGLLSKCYRYGKLNGVELGFYVDYPEKGDFVSYESEGFSCQGQIAAKVGEIPPAYSRFLTSTRRRRPSPRTTIQTVFQRR